MTSWPQWPHGRRWAACYQCRLLPRGIDYFSARNSTMAQCKLWGRKGETFDGGMRVPFIARFPGSIPAGQVNSTGVATALDLVPTIASLTGSPLPGNPLDGVNIWPMLSGGQDSMDRDVFLFIDTENIQAARLGPWKLHVARYNTPPWVPLPESGRRNLPLSSPELYNILNDPGESSDVADDNPQMVAQIQAAIKTLLPVCRARFNLPGISP